MKTTKRILALLMAMTLVIALGATAFAETADLTGHTYTAYKIFNGTQAEGSDLLADVTWGDGVDGDALLALITGTDADAAYIQGTPAANIFAGCESAADVALVLSEYGDKSAVAKAFAQDAYDCITTVGKAVVNGQTEIDAGYYLVVDTTDPKVVGEDGVYNIALLQLTQKSTFAIETKVETITVDKEVKTGLNCTKLTEGSENYDAEHVHTKACYNWEDANQAALGDTVDFYATSSVPGTAVDYDKFVFVFGDTLSDGLTLDANSIKVVYVDGTEEKALISGTDYNVKIDGQTFQIALVDAKALAGKTIIAYYSATLNEDAIIGSVGNENAVTVTYSKKPNEKYEGTTDEKGFPKDSTSEIFGKTPEAKTLTFVVGVKINKVDQDGKVLTGAEFELTGDTTNIILVTEKKYVAPGEGETATYYGIKAGTDGKPTEWTTEAPKADAMKLIVDAKFNGGYVKAADTDEPAATDKTVDGVLYREAKQSDFDKGTQIFEFVEGTIKDYVLEGTDTVPTPHYVEKTITSKVETSDTVTAKKFVDANGEVFFLGLSEGTYTVKETTTPAGYNSIDDITITISATLPTEVKTGEETATWAGTYKIGDGKAADLAFTTIKLDEEDAADVGALSFTVVNQKGTTLPETGGIGTTIFYVVGGIMLVGAGVLLITKKRMSHAE